MDLIQPAILVESRAACTVCGRDETRDVISLPRFPLTGIFLKPGDPVPDYQFDLTLRVCDGCGHARLSDSLPVEDLYGPGYSHRSSVSFLSESASNFFLNYVRSLAGPRVFQCALEIGCNDFVLLRKLAPECERIVGIDPIWRGTLPDMGLSNATVFGNFIEEVDFASDLPARPDLIVSSHNLEHIVDPVREYRRLMDSAADDALFVIEVPDLECMVRSLRFDQVFHQHVHYFSLNSAIEFIRSVGGHYVAHTYNFDHWGGSLLFAFSKNSRSSAAPRINFRNSASIELAYATYRSRMDNFCKVLGRIDGPIWGYGGGQMVPAVAYHLASDLGFLEGILDDNPGRDGLSYPGLATRIVCTQGIPFPNNASILITTLDAAAAIVPRLREKGVRRILVPTDVF